MKGNSDYSFNNLIRFLPSSHDSHQPKKAKPQYQHDNIKSGNETKAFYEDLLKESENDPFTSSSISISKHYYSPPKKNYERGVIRKRRKDSCLTSEDTSPSDGNSTAFHSPSRAYFQTEIPNPQQRKHFKLMQSAQLGDKDEVINLLRTGLDINFQDFYGWTPLMCATKEGHVSVVKFLLNSNADKHVCNSTGDDAFSIAQSAGHSKLAQILKDFKWVQMKTEVKKVQSEDEHFFCETCNQNFLLKEQKSHFSSTVHLFNNGKKKSSPAFLIPETNRGFQMLLRSGWSGDSGLGPEGKGAKYPVKTVLKQDRKGLGGEPDQKKAKVTHFTAKDVKAIENKSVKSRELSVRTLAKKAQKLKEKRDKKWEKNLRYEFC